MIFNTHAKFEWRRDWSLSVPARRSDVLDEEKGVVIAGDKRLRSVPLHAGIPTKKFSGEAAHSKKCLPVPRGRKIAVVGEGGEDARRRRDNIVRVDVDDREFARGGRSSNRGGR